MESVAGDLKVLNHEVSFPEGLTGTYLGGPARVDAAPEIIAGRTDNVVRVRASTPAPALAAATGTPAFVGLDGMVEWRGTLRLPYEGGSQRRSRVPSLRFESSLRGTAVGLPAPFGKTAATTQALRAEIQWPTPTDAVVRASFGSIARAHLRVSQVEKAWQFTRGTLRFGESDPALPAADGLEIRGSLDKLDLSAWFGIGGGSEPAATPAKPRRTVSDYLRSADLSVRELSVFGFDFPNVTAKLLAGPTSWSVNVDSARARGSIVVPFNFRGHRTVAPESVEPVARRCRRAS